LRLVLFVGLFAATLVGTRASTAADTSADNDAEALFRAGRDAMRRGDYAAACESFAKSRRLEPTLGTRLNLSLCEAKQGQLLDARRELEAILADAHLDERRRTMTVTLLAELKERFARLVVWVAPEARASTRVSVDGHPLSDRDIAQPIEVDPGKHSVDFHSAGLRPRRLSIVVRERESVVITDPAPPVGSASPSTARPSSPDRRPPAQPGESGTTQRAVGYAVGGAGIAILVASGIFGLLALDAADTKDAHCDETGCEAEGIHAAGRSQQLGNAATAALALGALETGIGTYLVLSAPSASAGQHAGSLGDGILLGFRMDL
jgi:hypothetical protein